MKPSEIDKLVGANMRRIRQARGRSLEWVVAKLKSPIAWQMMWKYERAVNRVSAGVLGELSGIYAVPVTDFYEGIEVLIKTGVNPALIARDPFEAQIMNEYQKMMGDPTGQAASKFFTTATKALAWMLTRHLGETHGK